MISRRESFITQCAVLLDMALAAAAFFAAYGFRRGVGVLEPLESLDTYLFLLPLSLAFWIGGLAGKGAYRRLLSPRPLSEVLMELLQVSLIAGAAMTAALFLLKMPELSRTFILLHAALTFVFLVVSRLMRRGFLRLAQRRGCLRKDVLVVGAGPRARDFIWRLLEDVRGGIHVIGVLDEQADRVGGPVGEDLDGVKVIGTLDRLLPVLRAQPVDEVIFIVPRSWMEKIEALVRQCETVGVCATVVVDLFNLKLAKAQPSTLCGIPVISLDTAPRQEWKLAVKRLMDIAGSAACIAALSPVFLVVAGLVKLTSPGPVLFRQTRIGLHGRRFTFYKFRSMTADAEQRRSEVQALNEMSGPVFKAANDPRITPLGKYLRRWSLDELPQLFNVFKGDMSLVGPRPPLPSEVEQYEHWQSRRLSVKPGITGYWQVKGRNEIRDFEEWARLDLEYIDRWSLGFDVEILLKTIPAVVSGAGAK